MSNLFDPLTIRGTTLRNRIIVSSMCQYSSTDGYATEWHFVHLGSRAVGGAALVMTEASAVLPEGRISPQDLGFWDDGHIEMLARTVGFIHQQGALAGIQLAHAGRKASTYAPGRGQGAVPESAGGWQVAGPSEDAFSEDYPKPKPLTIEGIRAVTEAFAQAARRAIQAGFDVVEIHGAHGYLIHEFLSPFSNHRQDEYGGSIENRTRLAREVVKAAREVWPESLPLFFRISATDWQEGGWEPAQSVELARQVKSLGVDLVDCSSGGNLPDATIPAGPGYQTPFAERIRREAGVMTGTVGFITAPAQADHIIRSGQADAVLLAREMLRDPHWPLRAARELGYPTTWPVQYLRAAPQGSQPRQPVGNRNAGHVARR
ncbi:MAG TPA: NADH:flavin oxidoreductase/NADH oxidase [Terriglobia bacterium]|nr:NADH:flavin oxidoreductase/NADH oxidase [Terriglobia bacterium]